MAKEVRLPQLGQTMEEGTVVNCLVNVGDEVKKGDVIATIEAMKMEQEIKTEVEGEIKDIYIAEGDSVASGDVIMQIL